MKKTSDGIFSILDFVLKKKQLNLDFENIPSTFMLNRWISMSTPENAKIINETCNRWHQNTTLYNNTLLITKFLKCILQKYTKKISYFKKKPNKKTKDSIEFFSTEFSKKETIQQQLLLEELKSMTK